MPPSSPRFSVVIDTYNQAQFVARAVESALAQRTTGSVELLVVDDGSTDDTGAVLAKFGGAIRLIRQPNQGQAGALNTGIAHATGDWIAFLDGDDSWSAGWLTELEKAGATDVAFGFTRHIAADDREIGLDPPEKAGDAIRSHGGNGEWLRSGRSPWFPPTSGIAVRRELLAKIGPIPAPYRIAADGWLQLAATIFGTHFSWITSRLVNLRIHSENAWSGRSDFDPAAAVQRRELYERLAREVAPLSARAGRDASGLEHALAAQAQEFEIWEHILNGRRAQAIALAASWSPPPHVGGSRQRAFKRLHTLAATIAPVDAYAALRGTWRKSPLAGFLRTEGAE